MCTYMPAINKLNLTETKSYTLFFLFLDYLSVTLLATQYINCILKSKGNSYSLNAHQLSYIASSLFEFLEFRWVIENSTNLSNITYSGLLQSTGKRSLESHQNLSCPFVSKAQDIHEGADPGFEKGGDN